MADTYKPLIALTSEQKDLIIKFSKKYLPNCQVYIFGSRVKGTAKKFSDVDIALDDRLPILVETLACLQQELSQNLPYLVDLIDINKISVEFKKTIQKDLVKLS